MRPPLAAGPMSRKCSASNGDRMARSSVRTGANVANNPTNTAAGNAQRRQTVRIRNLIVGAPVWYLRIDAADCVLRQRRGRPREIALASARGQSGLHGTDDERVHLAIE